MADAAAALMRSIRRAGGVDQLPLIDGPVLERFHPRALAAALEEEVSRARANGWPKVSVHMDIDDALALARELMRR